MPTPQGMPRKITVSGGTQQVAYAVQLLNHKMYESGPGGLIEGPPATILDCPKSIIGRVIGKGGETINDLQGRSGARIQIDQNVPEGTPCKVLI